MTRNERRLANKQSPKSELELLFARALQFQQSGQFEQAAETYMKILNEVPTHAESHNNMGNIFMQKGRPDKALLCYERAVTLKPEYAQAHNNIGNIRMMRGELVGAEASFRAALALLPNMSEIHNNLGSVLEKQGSFEEAVEGYERAVALNPKNAAAFNNLGTLLVRLGKLDAARFCFDSALAANADYIEARNNLANLLVAQNRLEQAEAQFQRVLKLIPDHPAVHYNRSALKTYQAGDADLAALEKMAADTARIPSAKRPYIHFALAKALDDVGDYARAFGQFEKGNALKREITPYDEAAVFKRFEDAANITAFDGKAGDPSNVPVFIIGMPRSGTTLVEQVLASHAAVHGAGELDNIRRLRGTPREMGAAYVKSLPDVPEGKTRIINKMPTNFLNAGLIHQMLPNAKIIHVTRDAADTCFSCYSKLFMYGHDFSYELGELGRYYQRCEGLMQHWRKVLPKGAMLEVSYETLVGGLEGEARRMLEFLGLPWDERALRFYDTDRAINTASNVQVRQKLFTRSIGRWKHYEANLKPLLEALNG